MIKDLRGQTLRHKEFEEISFGLGKCLSYFSIEKKRIKIITGEEALLMSTIRDTYNKAMLLCSVGL